MLLTVKSAVMMQAEDGVAEKEEVSSKKDPTHYSKLDPKILKVCDLSFPTVYAIESITYMYFNNESNAFRIDIYLHFTAKCLVSLKY